MGKVFFSLFLCIWCPNKTFYNLEKIQPQVITDSSINLPFIVEEIGLGGLSHFLFQKQINSWGQDKMTSSRVKKCAPYTSNTLMAASSLTVTSRTSCCSSMVTDKHVSLKMASSSLYVRPFIQQVCIAQYTSEKGPLSNGTFLFRL